MVAAVATYVSAQQCVTETSESRRRSWRTQRTYALSPAEVTGFDPATLELGSMEVGTPADCMTWHQVPQRILWRAECNHTGHETQTQHPTLHSLPVNAAVQNISRDCVPDRAMPGQGIRESTSYTSQHGNDRNQYHNSATPKGKVHQQRHTDTSLRLRPIEVTTLIQFIHKLTPSNSQLLQ